MAYGCTLVMISVLDSNNNYMEGCDIPAVLVICDAGEEDVFEEADFAPELTSGSTDFVFIFAVGAVEMLGDSRDNIGLLQNRCYQQHPISGSSIAGKEGGTAGLFLRANDRFWGLSCGHVLGEKSDAEELVAQPWPYDFEKYLDIADKRVKVLQNDVQNTKNEITKLLRLEELNALQEQLKILQPLRPADPIDMHNTLRFGKILQSHMGVVDHGGCKRFLDIGTFEIDADRIPQGGLDTATSAPQIVGPDEGVLGARQSHGMSKMGFIGPQIRTDHWIDVWLCCRCVF